MRQGWAHWRERPDGARWRGFEATGLIPFVATSPAWFFVGWWTLAFLPLLVLGWADIELGLAGVRVRRWIGPVPWRARRWPPNGVFDGASTFDGPDDAVVYHPPGAGSPLGETLVWRRDGEPIAARLNEAARRAWRAEGEPPSRAP